MGLIRGLVTLGTAMIMLDIVKEAKKRIDKIEQIDTRTKQNKDDIERMREILERWDRDHLYGKK